MKIIVTGSLGNIGKKLATMLVAGGQDVTVVTSQEKRRAAIENLGATAAIGSVSDATFLAQTFAGADSVFVLTPPALGGSDVIANTANAGKAFAEAFKTANVKRVVMLSSIGADLPGGTGPIEGLYHIEQAFRQLKGINITFLRAGYFYTNYYNDVTLIKTAGILGSNLPGETLIPLVHPQDIATAAAEELQQSGNGTHVRYIVSDYRTAAEVAQALGKAIGKPELPWVPFSDEQFVEGATQAGVPAEMAHLYADMGAGLRKGAIQSDFAKTGATVTGTTKLEDFAKEFAGAF
ncbi:NmrA family NAD(P)-binding protein [uncultured Chitinophaga sp.]|uniref:NmrA family NAD(P)-binding protein n=1 Tax=uncultured Chitinophaga sp. TaxID=339340 RepID=UPI0025D6A631|nr:NmrA family NAD(P)-binding protein [uncultured Chitinophaga sp.]